MDKKNLTKIQRKSIFIEVQQNQRLIHTIYNLSFSFYISTSYQFYKMDIPTSPNISVFEKKIGDLPEFY